jgi:tryptophan halogenase
MENKESIGPIGPNINGYRQDPEQKKFSFVVVGGGTAGWMTALHMKAYYPWANITVIASEEIGILGAGEGTTPHFVSFLNKVGISVNEIIKHANGTFKNGIKFTDWKGDDTSYFHGFWENYDLNLFKALDIDDNGISTLALEQIAKGESLDDVMFSAQSSAKNLVNFSPNLSINSKGDDPLYHFNDLSNYGLHFDARLLAKFLKKTSMYRGIKYIDSKIAGIESDDDGFITSILTERGDKLTCNFVFDCTGFAREIIGKHFNTEWISYSDHLPMKRALPFFLSINENEIPPYTEAKALKYGWMWQIPVQTRYGCGYVFDSDYIDDEQAKAEIREMYGDDVEFGNTFKFDPGRYKESWVKNCIAVGLSSGFVEPLEATSLWTSTTALKQYLANNLGAIEKNQFYIDRYNAKMNRFQDDTKDFIYLHYYTTRDDSDFWREFKQKNKPTENIQKLIDNCKKAMLDKDFIYDINQAYSNASFYPVVYGVGLFDNHVAFKTINSIYSDARRDSSNSQIRNYLLNMHLNVKTLIDHAEFIKYIKV